jgi:hypothetical protein
MYADAIYQAPRSGPEKRPAGDRAPGAAGAGRGAGTMPDGDFSGNYPINRRFPINRRGMSDR